MDLNKLRIFHAVAEAGSFSAAGRLLYLSQPSVSAHIKDLEREVGVALFERLRRGARLTTAGDALASYARRIFALE
ncbi:MAG: LysR family transcriptional regulator, partial [Candidatus Methylomirabilales bacterium]